MTAWTKDLPYFGYDEVKCKGTGVILIDLEFAAALPFLRLKWGESLSLNSLCRTPAHNAKEGGHPTSLHLTQNPKHKTAGSAAADIRWRGWPAEKQLRFTRLAWSLGFSVGLHDGFCHVDWRIGCGLPQAVFLYGTWTGKFKPEDVK
jgi:hypothetical protein